MTLRSLAYTSLARLDLDENDLTRIHESARHLNALDGITGLLVFNGSRFLQIVEGNPEAIDDLIERLRSDDRHSAIEIRDDRRVDRRSFPDWSMELVRVNSGYLEAREEIGDALPEGTEPGVRQLVFDMSRNIALDA